MITTDNTNKPEVEVLEDDEYGILEGHLLFTKHAGSSGSSIKDAWNNSLIGTICSTLIRGSRKFNEELAEMNKATEIIETEVLDVQETVRPLDPPEL